MTHGMSYQVGLVPPRHAGPRHPGSETPAESLKLPQAGAQRMEWEGESSAWRVDVPGDLWETLRRMNRRVRRRMSEEWTEQLRSRMAGGEVAEEVTGTPQRLRRPSSH